MTGGHVVTAGTAPQCPASTRRRQVRAATGERFQQALEDHDAAEIDQGQQCREQTIDQRPVDDGVDMVQAVAQDGDTCVCQAYTLKFDSRKADMSGQTENPMKIASVPV